MLRGTRIPALAGGIGSLIAFERFWVHGGTPRIRLHPWRGFIIGFELQSSLTSRGFSDPIPTIPHSLSPRLSPMHFAGRRPGAAKGLYRGCRKTEEGTQCRAGRCRPAGMTEAVTEPLGASSQTRSRLGWAAGLRLRQRRQRLQQSVSSAAEQPPEPEQLC